MPLYSNLASLSQTPGSNAADGSSDAPSTVDQQTNLLAAFIAQLRDGNGFTTGLGNLGQCRLTKSGANLLLSPLNGNGLTINGVVCKIPSAGLTLAPTALAVATTYFIYAVATGTAVSSLEASATGHSTDTATGVEIKTGDPTRTLVGMARTIAGPAWVDATNQRFVLSWFNRRPINTGAVLGSNASIFSLSFAEISTSLRNEFLIWSSDYANFGFQGSASNNVTNAVTYTTIALDGVTGDSHSAGAHYITNAIIPISVALQVQAGQTEGYHYATPYTLQNTTATSTYTGNGSLSTRCVMSGVIQG
ncbi:conserved hypothetical protein [Burkholderiales bacterium 8X]|nr:conserved hypothetical protein [Burkholderiales bacterium 8X]